MVKTSACNFLCLFILQKRFLYLSWETAKSLTLLSYIYKVQLPGKGRKWSCLSYNSIEACAVYIHSWSLGCAPSPTSAWGLKLESITMGFFVQERRRFQCLSDRSLQIQEDEVIVMFECWENERFWPLASAFCAITTCYHQMPALLFYLNLIRSLTGRVREGHPTLLSPSAFQLTTQSTSASNRDSHPLTSLPPVPSAHGQ